MSFFKKGLALFLILSVVFSCSKEDESSSEMKSKSMTTVSYDYSDFNMNQPDYFEDQSEVAIAGELREDSDVSAITVNYFDPSKFDMEPFESVDDGKPLEIVDFGPEGELPNEMTKKPTIYFVFSKAIVPLSKLGDPMTSFPGVTIEPEVKGTFRWYGSKMLSFEPSDTIMPLRNYLVSIDASKFKSLSGATLSENFSFSFYTEKIKITACYPYSESGEYINANDMPIHLAKKYLLQLSYPFDLEYMRQFITVECKNKSYDFTFERHQAFSKNDNMFNRSAIITVAQDFPENSQVKITMKAGAAPDALSNKTTANDARTFNTIKPFIFKDHGNYNYSYSDSDQNDANPLYLYFSHPIDKATVLGNLSTSFGIADMSDYVKVQGGVIKVFNLPVDYDTEYSVSFTKNIKDIYGRSLTKGENLTISVGSAMTFVHFKDSGYRILEAGFPAKTAYSFQNVVDGFSAISKVDHPRSFKAPSMKSFDLNQIPNTKHIRFNDFSKLLNDEGFGAAYIGTHIRYIPYWKKNKSNISEEDYYSSRSDLLLQVTDLGVTVRYGYNKILIYVKSMSTGKAVANADVEVFYSTDRKGLSAKTNSDGLAVIDFESFPYSDSYSRVEGGYKFETASFYMRGLVVKVSKDTDSVVFTPGDSHNRWRYRLYSSDSPYHVQKSRTYNLGFTDRGLYKPGESLSFKGIIQSRSVGEYTPASGSVTLTSSFGNGNEEYNYSETKQLSDSGAYHGTFKIPETTKPGQYFIKISNGINSFYIDYMVAEFKRAEFQVKIQQPDGVFLAGDKIALKGEAEYLSGGKMKGNDYSYFWVVDGGRFTPVNNRLKGLSFGPDAYIQRYTVAQSNGQLGVDGSADLEVTTSAGSVVGKTLKYDVEFSAVDESRQELATRASVTVHPAEFYIGARIGAAGEQTWWSRYVKKGDKMSFSIATAGVDGDFYRKAVTANVKVIRYQWKEIQQQGVYGNINYRWVREEVEELTDKVNITRGGFSTFSFTPKDGGAYKFEITADDDKGRKAVTQIEFYATGGSWFYWASDNPTGIDLVPEKDYYKPGETARIFMKSPLPAGEYLLTIEREGILEEKIIKLNEQSQMLEIPVKEEYLPVFYVSVATGSSRTGEPPKTYYEPDLGKPKSYFGMTAVLVDTAKKQLEVEIIPVQKIFKPGQKGLVKVCVTRDGAPVSGAEITFLAVDRGVLDLIDYHVPEPVSFFYDPGKFPHAVIGGDSRNLLIDPVTYDVKDLAGGDAGKDKVREDFNPLAVFEPMVITDENGCALVEFKFPDTLTTYRSTAFVVDGNKFGYREHELFVRNPITVRTAKPLALRLRDTTEMGVILTNLTESDWDISITASSDILKLSGPAKKTIKLKAGETTLLPFEFQAVKEGVANIEYIVESDVLKEKLREKIEIRKPHIKESFTIAGYAGKYKGDGEADATATEEATGEVSDISLEGFMLPSALDPGYGGITISLTNNPFSSLDSCISYINDFGYRPFSYTDYMYRAYPDMLFGANLSKVAIGERFDNSDIKDFADLVKYYQYKDGGINLYPRHSKKSDPYISIATAEFLHYASLRNLKTVSDGDKNKLYKYLVSLDSDKDFNTWLMPKLIYVRALYGENVKTLADKAMKNEDALGLDGYLYLGLAYYENGYTKDAEKVLGRVKKFIKVGTRSIDLVNTYETWSYFYNPVQSLSLLCRLHYNLKSIDDMFVRYTTTISNYLKYGHWNYPSAGLEYLISAADIYHKSKSMTEDVVAEVRLDGSKLMEATLKVGDSGFTSSKFRIFEEPLSKVKRDTPLAFEFESKSEGKVFYSANFVYALPAELIKARDEGIGVFAQISDLDGNIVKGNTLDIGKTYRMKVVLTSSKTRYNLGLRVPVPSGCDVINSSFVTSGTYEDKGNTDNRSWKRDEQYGDEEEYVDEGYLYYDYFSYYAYSIRPEKVIYKNEVTYRFMTFYRGQQTLDFLFRATTPGTYPTPPAFAEVIDESEVFGRSEGRIFTIK
ncbi:MAG: hypothetical protein JXR63_11505 [Spirochaetales bacterium]|nr:hypothetical protein [Spirochaetales bacterium]